MKDVVSARLTSMNQRGGQAPFRRDRPAGIDRKLDGEVPTNKPSPSESKNNPFPTFQQNPQRKKIQTGMILLVLKGILVALLSAIGGIAAILVRPFDRNRNAFHWIPRTHSRIVLKLFGIRLEVRGGENIQPGRSYVYVANHASLFDIPATVFGIPDRVHIVYKRELHRIPFFGWGLKFGSDYIAIDRGRGADAARSLEHAVEKIRGGKSVLLFAEGTRTKDGKLQPFKRGAFNLAVKAGVPVIPVTINGSFKILPKGTFAMNPGTITLTIDKPIKVRRDGKDEELKLMEEVHKVIEKTYIDQ